MKPDIKRQCSTYADQSLKRCTRIASFLILLNLLLRDAQARRQFPLSHIGCNARMDQEFWQVI